MLEAKKNESKQNSSSNPINIDDIPIPTATSAKPKSFNDLLQEKLKLEGQMVAESDQQE